ncbi:amino acid deaminase/aldolase [Solirubrobacter sp. CPCC 204708]|uniref:amino acid deaminase/aldolase n=1 Tax=Solirubrobacter deserti TaxID=2282478 RepID=UPI001930B2DD|nr:amino acid deaminase/aldolase [Solirubrobacter deserti]
MNLLQRPIQSTLISATFGLDAPFAVIDLDAFDFNAADLKRRARGVPLRLASKSLRVRALQERALNAGFAGVLAFTLPEALWLASHGWDDLVVGYPTVDRAALRELVRGPARERVTVMVDCAEHLDLIAAAEPAGRVKVCIDVDAGWRPLGGLMTLGAKRSPLHDPVQVGAFAREVVAREYLELDGLMAYEGQIAGVGDKPPGRPLMRLALPIVQGLSARELARRRAEIVDAVRSVAPLRFVNGGGTGSVERTAAEPAVTEVAAGSGLFGPTLFDTYRAFRPAPAAFFVLPVVRKPSPKLATALGGGYVASGAPGRDRLPRPVLPHGLKLDALEAAGEVQTPLLGSAAAGLRVGDQVWFRHAKAGELCERFDVVHLVQGGELVDTVPTYRGEGKTFL